MLWSDHMCKCVAFWRHISIWWAVLKVSKSQKKYGVLNSSKKRTNLTIPGIFVLPNMLRILSFVRVLEGLRTPWIAFEIYWPLEPFNFNKSENFHWLHKAIYKNKKKHDYLFFWFATRIFGRLVRVWMYLKSF